MFVVAMAAAVPWRSGVQAPAVITGRGMKERWGENARRRAGIFTKQCFAADKFSRRNSDLVDNSQPLSSLTETHVHAAFDALSLLKNVKNLTTSAKNSLT